MFTHVSTSFTEGATGARFLSAVNVPVVMLQRPGSCIKVCMSLLLLGMCMYRGCTEERTRVRTMYSIGAGRSYPGVHLVFVGFGLSFCVAGERDATLSCEQPQLSCSIRISQSTEATPSSTHQLSIRMCTYRELMAHSLILRLVTLSIREETPFALHKL